MPNHVSETLVEKIVLGVIVFATHYSQSEELECLRLYSAWSNPEDWEGSQLMEKKATYDRYKPIVEYVEKGCPEFHNMDLVYDNAKTYVENYDSLP